MDPACFSDIEFRFHTEVRPGCLLLPTLLENTTQNIRPSSTPYSTYTTSNKCCSRQRATFRRGKIRQYHQLAERHRAGSTCLGQCVALEEQQILGPSRTGYCGDRLDMLRLLRRAQRLHSPKASILDVAPAPATGFSNDRSSHCDTPEMVHFPGTRWALRCLPGWNP